MSCCCGASPGSPASPEKSGAGSPASPAPTDTQSRRLLPIRTDGCILADISRVQRKSGLTLCPRPTPSVSAPPPKHLVRLNIYHLIDEATNLKFLRFGFGVFHSGVIVYGIEWSFGESVEGQETGLFCVAPGNAAGIVFKTLDLGYTDLSPEQVDTVLHRLETEWKSSDYHVLHQNCNHFAARFCELLSTLEKLEVPAWCNRAARWSDKIVPKGVASWALRNMEDYQPPPLATTRGVHPNIGELPTSIIPLQWYRSPALRRGPRYVISPLLTTQPGFAPPRRDAPPRAAVSPAALSTAHLQSTPPPPGKADVMTPEPSALATSNNTGRLPVLSHDSGSVVAGGRAGAPPQPGAARRLDEGFDSVLVPQTRGAVRMPDFNKNLHRGREGAAAPNHDGSNYDAAVAAGPNLPVVEESSGNRGAESKQLRDSTGRVSAVALKHHLTMPRLSTPPPAPGSEFRGDGGGGATSTASGNSEAPPSAAQLATSSRNNTAVVPDTARAGIPSVLSEEPIAFTDDIHLMEAATSGSAVPMRASATPQATPEEYPGVQFTSHLHHPSDRQHREGESLHDISVRDLVIPLDVSIDAHLSDAFSLSPPALARSATNDANQLHHAESGDGALPVVPWSASSRSLVSPARGRRPLAVVLDISAVQVLSEGPLEKESTRSVAMDDDDADAAAIEASPMVGPLAATTGTMDEEVVVLGSSKERDDELLHTSTFHVDTVPLRVDRGAAGRRIELAAVSDDGIPTGGDGGAMVGGGGGVDHYHVTRTASFTRPSVASVYSTASGTPHSSRSPHADGVDTPGVRTEDATIFTEA